MEHAADTKAVWLHESALEGLLEKHQAEDRQHVRDVLNKARSLSGLSLEDVAVLMTVHSQDLLDELFHTAKSVKEEIYGNRIVLFAPLYISNLCSNECLYCAFRRSNKEVIRRALNPDEIRQETKILLRQGHKRVLMVAGEAYPGSGIDYVLESIDAIYGAEENGSRIRRVNVNLAPLSVEDFRRLKERNIGTFQLFQETYHRPTYGRVHLAGPKKDLDWRASSFDRAMQAGIDDVGIGLLYGLYDWRFETLALMAHIAHLEERFGVGCHTISVPRIEPAIGSDLASRPPYALDDQDFLKLVAILRLAVPYTGIIMSTRENPAADAGTRRFPDFGGQPYQSRWLSGIQPVRGGTISAWRSPLPRGSDCRSRTAQIHSLFLHRLLSSRAYRQRFHGSGETGPHQGKMRAQRSVHL